MWQDSQYVDSSNFDLQRSYQEFQESQDLEVAPSTDIDVLRDAKNRRIITRNNLYEDPDSFKFHNQEDSEINNETIKEVAETSTSSNHWTSGHWLKGNATQESGASCSSRPFRGPALNKLEKKIGKALAKPVQLSKAESMMQRMGWKGGALGKDGKGILEPIAPNAAYAVRNLGFGHKIERVSKQCVSRKVGSMKQMRAKLKQKHQLKKFDKDIFKTNVLLIIWDFVINDRELEIVFETKLSKNERRNIHLLTERINQGAVPFKSLKQMDIAMAIDKCNMYKLCTESEGKDPHRSLCLYKSAPDHIYLVSPYELEPDEGNTTENSAVTTEGETATNKSDKPENCNSDENLDSNKAIDSNSKNKSEKIKMSPRNVALNSVIDLTNDIEDNNQEFDTRNPFLASITRHLSHTINKPENPSMETENVAIDEKNTFTEDKVVTIEDKPQEIVPDIQMDMKQIDSKIEKLDNKLENVKFVKENLKTLTDNEIRDLLIEYISEFFETDECTEFRFCGAFSDDQLNVINKFMNDFEISLSEPNRCSDLFNNETFAKLLREEGCNFEVSEDVNGHTVIYKRQKKRKLE